MATNYTDTTWVTGSAPGISAAELNRIDSGVEALYQELDALVGALVMYAAATAPSAKWLICDGAEISRTTYADLFTLIGHTYGTNPGGGDFTLPDFRGRLPIGQVDTSPAALNALGKTAGDWDHRHEQNAHSHAGGDHTHSIPTSDSGGAAHNHTATFLPAQMVSHGHALSGLVAADVRAPYAHSTRWPDSVSLYRLTRLRTVSSQNAVPQGRRQPQHRSTGHCTAATAANLDRPPHPRCRHTWPSPSTTSQATPTPPATPGGNRRPHSQFRRRHRCRLRRQPNRRWRQRHRRR